MLAASWFEQQAGMVFIVIIFLMVMAKKYLANHQDVKDAAKKAVANKAIGLIGRMFK